MVRTTGNQTSKLTHRLPNTMRKRLPSPKYHLYLTPYQFETLAFQKTSKWPGLGEGGHERGKAREAKGRHTHLGACARLRVAPKEHVMSQYLHTRVHGQVLYDQLLSGR